MLTLLHISGGLDAHGGTPRKLLYLVRNMEPGRCRQLFLCYRPSPLREELERHGAVVKCLDRSSPEAIVRSAVRLIRSERVDAVCTHFTRPLIAGYIAARAVGIPQIHNQHSSAAYIRGLGRTLTRLVLPRTQAIVCNSQHTLDSVRREFGLPREKLFVLHNPVVPREKTLSRDEFRRRMGLADDGLLIGHVGGMIPERDQATLIRAFARVHAGRPGARLVLIGDGPVRGALESLAARLGLESCVAFPGYAENVGDYLEAMDIFVNPTLDEGFGIAVVEAMLARLPVVLSDRGAHPELVEHEVSGMLFRGGDIDSLTNILYRLAGNAALRRRLGESAFPDARARFHPKVYADAYRERAREVVDIYRAKTHRRTAG